MNGLSLKYVIGSKNVDCMTIGITSVEQVEDLQTSSGVPFQRAG